MKPWASGSKEVLEHGLSLMRADSDGNRRLAFINIDNAVELMVATFLTVPKRITGFLVSREEFDKISGSFYGLLETLEKKAPGRIKGVDLAEVEWYHGIRNRLYHQGIGTTVERNVLEVYAELAKLIFRNLFDSEIKSRETDRTEDLGRFIFDWARLHRAAERLTPRMRKGTAYSTTTLGDLRRSGLVSQKVMQDIYQLYVIRNRIVHAKEDHRELLNPQVLDKLRNTVDQLESLESKSQNHS